MSQNKLLFNRTLFLVAAGVILLGCGGGGDSSAGSTAGASALTGAPRSLPGSLTQPIDDLTDGELWAAVSAMPLATSGPAQERRCASPPVTCYGTITAIAQDPPGPGNISPNGTVVAILANLGNAPGGGADVGAERKYGTTMDPNRKYVLVGLQDGTKWTWEVRVAVNGGTTRPAARTERGAWGVCEETQSDTDHPKGKSEFYKCKKYKPLVEGDSATTTANWVRNAFDAPGWLDCSAGCCTAGQ